MIAQASSPRVRYVPEVEACYDLAEASIELAKACELTLDPWQEDLARAMLAYRADGRWVAEEVGACVPRQNGKNGVTEVRQLAGLFLVGEFPVQRSRDPLAVHTAHLDDTAMESFRRLELLIDANEELGRKVKRVARANGKASIETKTGERIRYRARTKGGGRGYGGDDLYLDEAMGLPEFGYGALRPILSARPNPQIVYTGSAVDQELHDDGIVFARVRERGVAGTDPRLAYFEWSLPYEHPDDVPEEALTDPEAWARANPALGIRILPETVESEQRSMANRSFIVERLGVGDWPDTDASHHVIDMKLWADLADLHSEPLEPLCFAFDVAPDRSRASIAVAGRRADGSLHVDVGERAAGTGWVLPRLEQLLAGRECLTPLCDGPAASLIPGLEQAGIKVKTTTAGEMAQACGNFYDLCEQRVLRHRGQGELTSALKGAAQRTLGEAWAWSRKNSAVDISPLVAATLAAWGLTSRRQKVPMIGSVAR